MPVNVLMIGTGEYTSGYTGQPGPAKSDKGPGVVALTLFSLRTQGLISRLAMCGTNGTKFPQIRAHIKRNIQDIYSDLSTDNDVAFESFPADDKVDPLSYIDAIKTFKRGDIAIVFTPDSTHFDIAKACIVHGLHVMVTKPIVQTLDDHITLNRLAKDNNVLCAIEVHKRLDPIYEDARDRIKNLGGLCFFTSYMSQPKHQLNTFKAWAGASGAQSKASSDISYYLNSHHVDFTEWALRGVARPVYVSAIASVGVAKKLGTDTEDAITLSVVWENLTEDGKPSESRGTATYTSSWVAPSGECHSQQRFFYMGETGEINVDQAHRGYSVTTDSVGYKSVNPLFMKYTPDGYTGNFAGRNSYGCRSFSDYIAACAAINEGGLTVEQCDDGGKLATVGTTLQSTAILEGGRRSLDNDGRGVVILYDDEGGIDGVAGHSPVGLEFKVYK